MKTVILTIKKNKAMLERYDSHCWDVKNSRKLHARICLVKYGENTGTYQIEKCGMAFHRETLDAAKAFVIAQAEDFLNMLNFETKVEIVEAK